MLVFTVFLFTCSCRKSSAIAATSWSFCSDMKLYTSLQTRNNRNKAIYELKCYQSRVKSFLCTDLTVPWSYLGVQRTGLSWRRILPTGGASSSSSQPVRSR